MDVVDNKTRSMIMSKIKSNRNMSTEIKLIGIFKKNHIIGWRRRFPLSGKPDFVFPRSRLAVFVDGCFWHGHKIKCRIPKTNREYWINKIERNRLRDKKVNRELRKKGWNVLRIWENNVNDKSTVIKLLKAIGT